MIARNTQWSPVIQVHINMKLFNLSSWEITVYKINTIVVMDERVSKYKESHHYTRFNAFIATCKIDVSS